MNNENKKVFAAIELIRWQISWLCLQPLNYPFNLANNVPKYITFQMIATNLTSTDVYGLNSDALKRTGMQTNAHVCSNFNAC